MVQFEWSDGTLPSDFIAVDIPFCGVSLGRDEIYLRIRNAKNYLLKIQAPEYRGSIERMIIDVNRDELVIIAKGRSVIFNHTNGTYRKINIYPCQKFYKYEDYVVILDFRSICLVKQSGVLKYYEFDDDIESISRIGSNALEVTLSEGSDRNYIVSLELGNVDKGDPQII